jgi:hypothetical protein
VLLPGVSLSAATDGVSSGSCFNCDT